MKTYFRLLLCAMLAFTAGCSHDDEIDYSAMAIPEIDFVMDGLTVDLNKGDNLPIVAVIFSEAGIDKIDMYIIRNGTAEFYKTVDSFYDRSKHSIKENLIYTSDVEAFKIIATDRGGRSVENMLPITLIPFQDPPTIVFDPEEMIIDERVGTEIPPTKFTVTSSPTTLLSQVNAVIFTRSGDKRQVVTEDFAEQETTEYTFAEDVIYMDGDRSLQVTATDRYGKVTISSMPVTYIAIPPPALSELPARYILDLGATLDLSFTATSESGIKSVVIYKSDKNAQTVLFNQTYQNPATVGVEESFTMDDPATVSLKIVVTDKNNKATTAEIPVILGMTYIERYKIGGQYYTLGYSEDPDNIRHFFSFAKMSGLTLAEAYGNIADADLYFYMYKQTAATACSSVLRINSLDYSGQAADIEYKDDTNGIPLVSTWGGRNVTKIVKLDPAAAGFDFDNVSLSDLQNYTGTISGTRITAPAVGDVYIVRTAASSTAGEKVGLLRLDSYSVATKLPFGNSRYEYGTQHYKAASVVEISVKFPK